MPTGMLNDMEFENKLAELGENQLELIKFVARQQYTSCKLQMIHESRIKTLESGSKSISGITGGITGAITAVIIGIINYFTTNRG